MANISLHLVTMLVIYSTLSSSSNTTLSKLKGFSTHLIHRDSSESPFYQENLNDTTRMVDAIHRSKCRLSRVNSILELSNNKAGKTYDIYTRIMPTDSSYLMEISIGTPPVKQLVVADTGSDVTWTQCLPCVNCYEQKQIMFNSQNSSSYKVLACGSNPCKALGKMRICNELSELKCRYNLSYVDGTNSLGELAWETYNLGGTSIPNMVYGCGNDNSISINDITSGIFGLGRGPLSFLGQLPIHLGRKLSYCLVSHSKLNVRSKLNFGANAIVSGPGVVSTPLVTKTSSPLYYLTLEAISVNNMRIPFTRRVTRSMEDGDVDIIEKGNILIDSGTPITYLPMNVYQNLKDALKSAIQADSIPVPKYPWMLCYKNNKELSIPTITFHFDGGANLTFPSTSTFMPIEDVLFLRMIPNTNKDEAIYGNFLQMNFLIGFDIEKGKVFFKPTDCSRRTDSSEEWSMAS